MSDENALTVPDRDYVPDPTQGEYHPLAVWQSKQAPAVTSLDVQTDEGAKAYLRCLRNSDLKAKECTAQPIEIAAWFLHVVKPMVSADGEEGSNLRLVFVLTDGRTVSTRAKAVLDFWRHTVQLMKLREWKFPLRLKLRSVPIGDGFSYLECESVEPCHPAAVRKVK